ncbi:MULTISPECIES: SU10 major capsid protein [Actinomycetes]|uniref:SU10 major capsid protein n=1 Tax=Micromonospora sp. NPDC005367 TaxID=3155590 RepID=UPI00339F525C
MATVSGQGTTYNLPNYTGELYTVAPSDTPFLSAIGGLNGGQSTTSVEFEWQTEDLESTAVNNTKVEGAAAPTASGVSRSNVSNVVEIHQEAIEVSYTKQAAVGLHNGINSEEPNPVRDELTRQVQAKLRKVAVDIEKSFLSGVYQKPANNSTARQTRGVLTAISTNVFANGGTGRALSKAIIDSALSAMFTAGATLDQDNTVLMLGPAQKVALSNLYAAAPLNQPTMTRNIGGVAVDTVVTDFGTFGVMLNRWFPTGQIGIIDLSVCNPVFLNIPNKGTGIFVEPLAKTGASDKFQLYGEVGLKYGPEVYHGLIKDLT